MQKTPYLQVVDQRLQMGGVGAPRSTVFGVLGRTKQDPYTRSLGGLIQTTTSGSLPNPSESVSSFDRNTQFKILGPASKTKVPGEHYGQIPYPGAFRSHLGGRV